MELIDKEKVIEEILKRKSEIYDEYGRIVTTQRGLVEYKVLQEMQSFLNTLEVKEVDLEKEIKEEYLKRRRYGGRDNMLVILNELQFNNIAKYFYELGINSK